MQPDTIPCRVCGRAIVRWRPNRRLCSKCAKESLRESKRLWQSHWRSRTKTPFYDRSEEQQRSDALLETEELT